MNARRTDTPRGSGGGHAVVLLLATGGLLTVARMFLNGVRNQTGQQGSASGGALRSLNDPTSTLVMIERIMFWSATASFAVAGAIMFPAILAIARHSRRPRHSDPGSPEYHLRSSDEPNSSWGDGDWPVRQR